MIVFRYLAKEVYAVMLATTLVLLMLLISNQFVQYLGEAAAGRLPVKAVMELMSLQMPMLLGLMLPLGLYLGILMGYGRVYADCEMTVLSACGFGKWRLVGMTLIISAGVMVIVGILMFWVQPHVEWYKHHIMQEAIRSSPLEKIYPDQFTPLGYGKWVVYADELSRDHKHLSGIFVAERNKQGEWTVINARSGRQMQNPKTHDEYIVLEDGHRYDGVIGSKKFAMMDFGEYGLRLSQFTKNISEKVQTLSTSTLWRMRRHDPQAAAELQWRMALPLCTLLLGLIAVSLSEVKPRQGRYAKLVPAIIIYIVYADLLFVARAWLRKGEVSHAIGLWWVHGVMLVITLLLLVRFIGWRQIKVLFESSNQ